MISHANLSSGQTADYYKKDDYYKSEDQGKWSGKLAEAKGLSGEIKQSDYDTMVEERGKRQGYDIQLNYEKAYDGQTQEARSAHAKAVEKVKEYIAGSDIKRAGKLDIEETAQGTTISIKNHSDINHQGIRKYEANDEFSQYKERIEQVYREAIQENTGRDVGKVEIKDTPVAQVAYDFTLSAPKSVSIAMAQGGQVEADMRKIHHEAVEATRKYMETYVEARRYQNGVETYQRTGNMMCAQFTHIVSRNQDPQLHTHLVIANKTKCSDGQERAIDNKSLVENKYHFDMVYKAELASRSQNRGYEIASDIKGSFELKEITRAHIESVSTRRAEIMEKVKEWGKDPQNANRDMRDAACQLTRDAKRNCDMSKLRESWAVTLKENGVPEIHAKEGPIRLTKSMDDVFRDTEKALASKTFAFQRKEFLDEALKRGMGHGITLQDAEKHFSARIQEREITPLGNLRGKEYYCTRESRDIEQAVFRNIAEGKGKVKGFDRATVDARMERGTTTPDGKTLTLTQEQQEAVRHISTTTDRFSAVQGLAGVGKTTAFNQVREIYEGQGYTVKGVCFQAKAAGQMEQDAAIPSCTIHRHLNDLEKEVGRMDGKIPSLDQRNLNGWNLEGLKSSGKELWIVDEASQVDNRLLRQLQAAALAKDAKVVFTGDAKQLQPIGAGNAFSNMIENDKIAHVKMTDIVRQKDPVLADRNDPGHKDYYLRQAVVSAVQGKDVKASIDKLAAHTHQIQDRDERFFTIAKDYAGFNKTERRETVILTGTNADRTALNARVRNELKEKGELKDGRNYSTSQGRREFAPGDKLIFLKNDNRLRVRNGDVGQVREVGEGRLAVAMGRKTVEVDLSKYKHVDHGYAMTAHKAQGITVNRALIHLDTQQRGVNSRNSFYVDVSRARHEVKIYTDDRGKLASSVGKWQHKLSSDDFPERDRGRDHAADRRGWSAERPQSKEIGMYNTKPSSAAPTREATGDQVRKEQAAPGREAAQENAPEQPENRREVAPTQEPPAREATAERVPESPERSAAPDQVRPEPGKPERQAPQDGPERSPQEKKERTGPDQVPENQPAQEMASGRPLSDQSHPEPVQNGPEASENRFNYQPYEHADIDTHEPDLTCQPGELEKYRSDLEQYQQAWDREHGVKVEYDNDRDRGMDR